MYSELNLDFVVNKTDNKNLIRFYSLLKFRERRTFTPFILSWLIVSEIQLLKFLSQKYNYDFPLIN